MQNIVNMVAILDFIVNIASYVGSNPTTSSNAGVGQVWYYVKKKDNLNRESQLLYVAISNIMLR